MKKIKVDDYLEMLISMMPDNLEFVNNTEKCVCAVMHYIADDDIGKSIENSSQHSRCCREITS